MRTTKEGVHTIFDTGIQRDMAPPIAARTMPNTSSECARRVAARSRRIIWPARISNSTVVDDSMLTASVKTKLVEDSTTKAYEINVGTQKGVVQLTGFVDSTTMKTRAGELARSVEGVKEVRNDLEIRQM